MRTLFLSFAAFIAACSQHPSAPSPPATRGTCYVCKYNNDLACVHFRLKPETPRLVHQGRTYEFCNDDCRDAFLKDPDKYRPKE